MPAAATPELQEQRLRLLESRIRDKISDYRRYGFSLDQAQALVLFFDLAQEFEDLSSIHLLPVVILDRFFGMKAELYIRSEGESFVRRSMPFTKKEVLPPFAELACGPVVMDNRYYFPARRRPAETEACFTTEPPPNEESERNRILAVLVLHPESPLTTHDSLYYEKFANRVGYCLHNHMLADKNREHIRFVKGLVHDIGHNVIVPNMYFKLLIKQMQGKLAAVGDLYQEMKENPSESTIVSLEHLYRRMLEQFQELTRHFHQTSFFMETLLRQSHFDQGQYVLQKTNVDIVQRVVAPQVERYLVRFQDKSIAVSERYPEDDSLKVFGDVGLLSQVIANFFSNALKYTRSNPGKSGLYLICSAERSPDFFGKGQDGARIAVITSGSPIPDQEAEKLFDENFRASNTEAEYGTGHGLYFIQVIMEQHGGMAGYKRVREGNMFYIIMPCEAAVNAGEVAA